MSEPAPLGPYGARPEPHDAVSGLSRENSLYRRTIAAYDRLADAAVQGVDPVELTRVFADLVGKQVVLMDPSFAVRAQAGGTRWRWDRSDPSVARLASALEARRRPMRVPPVPGFPLDRGLLVTPVAAGTRTLGYLLVVDNEEDAEPDDVDLLSATYAATLFALTLAHERTSTELGQRYRHAILEALVGGHFLDADDARDKARSLGVGEATPYRVGLIRVGPGDDPGAAVTEVAERVAEATPALVASPRQSSGHVLVLDAPAGGLAAAWDRLAARVPGTGLTCGLSEQLARPEQAPTGLRQAEQAIDLGVRLGRQGQLIAHDDLGIYRLLLRIGDMRELWEFADDVLGAVVDYDAAHRLELLSTLSVYLRRQGSLKQVARDLRVHPNTVAYRAHRIERLTGLDLSDPDDRLLAHVAVKIVESRRPEPRGRGMPGGQAGTR
ncbi:MAG: PucR family transcriptional regulator [Streptosporangiales bacterium]